MNNVLCSVQCAVAVERSAVLETCFSPVYLQPLVMLMCSHTVLYSAVHCYTIPQCTDLHCIGLQCLWFPIHNNKQSSQKESVRIYWDNMAWQILFLIGPKDWIILHIHKASTDFPSSLSPHSTLPSFLSSFLQFNSLFFKITTMLHSEILCAWHFYNIHNLLPSTGGQWYITVSLKEAFGQKVVPHQKKIAGSTWNCSIINIEVQALTRSSRAGGWLKQIPFVQGWSTHPAGVAFHSGGPWDDLKFWVINCPKCLSLKKWLSSLQK